MQKDLCLAIDLGTGGPKTAFVSLSGDIVAWDHQEVETTLDSSGKATQDTHQWMQKIKTSINNLAKEDPSLITRTFVITFTGQWGSTVPVNKEGEPVGDCILWMDTRGHKYSSKVMGTKSLFNIEGYKPLKVLKFLLKTAGAPSLEGNDPLGHFLLLKNEMPEIFEKTQYLLEPVDYLALKFGGKVFATAPSMILSWLINIKKLQEPTYDKTLLKLSQRDPSKLPPLRVFNEVVGTIAPEIQSLGFDPDTKVTTGCPDLLSAAAGSGNINDFEPHMAISTTSWISCHVPFKKTDPFRQIATVPGCFTGKYLLANNHDTAGICLTWFKDKILSDLKSTSYSELDNIASSVAPGSNGIIFAPWLNGERCPVYDRRLRASFINVSLNTTLNDLLRATLEGVAYNARWMLDAVEHMLKRKLGPIRTIGGGAKSALWCQIHADVLNRKIEQVKDPLLANVKGAAILAFLATGSISKSEIKNLVEINEVFKPNKEKNEIYEKNYSVFKKLYKSQKGFYNYLNSSY
jgi:xylulokinase